MPVVEHPSGLAPTQVTPPEQQTKARARKHTPLSDSDSDEVTGLVLASGRYKCTDPECQGLRFGRYADFKRHYTNVHAGKIIEYFCPKLGCERSRNPAKKSKGRSFKGRKDKMEEHFNTVHYKRSKKRRMSSETPPEDEEDAEEEQQQPKMRRRS